MVFDSLTFLIVFLPATLVVYWLLSPRLRNGWMAICGVAFLALGDPWYAPLLLVSGLVDYGLGIRIADTPSAAQKRGLFIGGVIKDGALLLLVKQYVGFPEVFYAAYPTLQLLIPVGLVVCSLKSISYLADVRSGVTPCQRRLIPLLLYFFFYPALPFGPVIRYRDFLPQLDPALRRPDKNQVLDSVWSLSKGLFKVVVLHRHCMDVWLAVSGSVGNSTSMLTSLGALFCGCLGLCFLWSGMQDLARGIGGLYGFSFRKSDDYPLMARGMTDFLRRTDRNLLLWLQTYPYSTSVTADLPTIRWIVNIILFFVFRSFFAGDFITLGIWLLGLLLYLLMDRLLYMRLICRAWKWLQHVYTWLLLLVLVVIFLLPDFSSLCSFAASLLRLGQFATLDSLLETFSRPILILLAVGFPLSVRFGFQRGVMRLLHRGNGKTDWLLLPAGLLLLFISLIFLM